MTALTLPIPDSPHRVPLYAPLDAQDYRARLDYLAATAGTEVLALLGRDARCWQPVVRGVPLAACAWWPEAAAAMRVALEAVPC